LARKNIRPKNKAETRDYKQKHRKTNMSIWPARPLKHFLTDRAITCGANGLSLWRNTKLVAIARKFRFHRMLPFMTKQRCSSVAATSRLHQKIGIIEASVATSDILTRIEPAYVIFVLW